MSRIKEFYNKYLSWINIYGLVIFIFCVLTFTAGDSSLIRRYQYDEQIRGLEKEIKMYQDEIDANRQKLDNLHKDKVSLERFAREEYHMKKPDEDIFLIKKK